MTLTHAEIAIEANTLPVCIIGCVGGFICLRSHHIYQSIIQSERQINTERDQNRDNQRRGGVCGWDVH